MSFERVNYNRLYEKILDQIEEQFKRGELKPGDRLPSERDLAEHIGVSRGTLREAFRVLENQGIIETRPGGGRFIRKVEYSELRGAGDGHSISSLETAAILDLLEARQVLEVKIAEVACEKASAEDIRELERCLAPDPTGRAPKEGDSKDGSFHLAIASATHNVIFVNVVKTNIDLMSKIREKTLISPVRKTEMNREHREIFEAIKERDPQKAREAMLRHLLTIRESILGRESGSGKEAEKAL